jgi:polysaccharide export outer membrane protein
MRLLVPSSLLALSLWAGAGCKTPRSDASTRVSMDEAQAAQPNNFEPASSNSLGVGDLVEVRVFQEADLSGAYRISSEGTIDFPLCGKVTLSGTSASEAADALKACLAGKYLKNPQVTVLIREYNSKKIFVFGEVNKPGTFPYDEKCPSSRR